LRCAPKARAAQAIPHIGNWAGARRGSAVVMNSGNEGQLIRVCGKGQGQTKLQRFSRRGHIFVTRRQARVRICDTDFMSVVPRPIASAQTNRIASALAVVIGASRQECANVAGVPGMGVLSFAGGGAVSPRSVSKQKCCARCGRIVRLRQQVGAIGQAPTRTRTPKGKAEVAVAGLGGVAACGGGIRRSNMANSLCVGAF